MAKFEMLQGTAINLTHTDATQLHLFSFNAEMLHKLQSSIQDMKFENLVIGKGSKFFF